jgi:dienelactone hydrolase
MLRRELLVAAGTAVVAAAVRPPWTLAADPPACYPGGAFDPDRWMAERGQGRLKTRTPQSDRPLRTIKATTPAEWADERRQYLTAWRELIGPWPARPAVDPQVHAVDETDAYTRYKVSYASLPGDPVVSRIAAWLLVPHGATAPRPAIVTLHQTIPQGKDEPAGIDASLPWMAYADYYARRGYVALAPDAVGYGERTRGCYANSGYELGDAWPLLRPHPQMTLLGLMLFDVTRAIDYLEGRPEVDPKRIGVIGHSQGGILVNGVLGLEPRFKVGIASCGYGIFRQDGYYDRWAAANSAYLPRMWLYRVERTALPIDMLQIMALASGQAHLVQTAMGDTVWTPPAVATDPVVARELRRVHNYSGTEFVSIEPGGAEKADKDHGWYPETQVAADALLARVLKP